MKAVITSTARLGREATFAVNQEEEESAKHDLRLQKMLFSLTLTEVLRLVHDFAEANIKNNVS
jgi:hypothetical protein